MAGKPTRKTLTLTTTQPARVEALEQTPVHSKLAAYVGEVLVDYGDQVKKDQPLLKLVAPELDADLVQKQALLEQARAGLLQAEAGSKAAEAAITTATAKAVQAEAGIDAEASLKDATAAIDAAKALVAQAQAEAAKAASDVTSAKAHIRVAQANLARSEAEHSYLTMRAPFDGIVTLRRVDLGHFVQPAASGSAPLLVVVRSDKMRVFVAVPESEAAYVDVGDPVTIESPTLGGAELKGKVTRTSAALDTVNRSLETIIDLDNSDGRLRSGLYATAKITKEAHCYRLISGKAAKTPIQLGIKVADEFEVTSGISDNDTVILNKAASLKDGQAVEQLKPTAK
ncbi:MAG: efflux RND transporter periplasmic adaptor subunit [Planctomycetia bacterium]|nr:efflux RND transporter periplasmic adaptor subunit [Planctomycetia bacterium]